MDYKIAMHPAAWDLFWAYVDLMPGEVGCFGYATLDTTHEEVYVSEIFLVPQEASATQVDFIEDGLPYAVNKAIEDGKLDKLRFCIHSHGTFDAKWSNTDEDMIKRIGHDAEWFASVIFNKKGATAGRIDTYNLPPFGKMQVTIKDLDVVCARPAEYDEQCIRDLEHFVKEPPKVPVMGTGKSLTKTYKVDSLTWESAEKALNKAMKDGTPVDVAGLARTCKWAAIDDNGITCYYDKEDSDVWVETIKTGTREELVLVVGSPDMEDVVDVDAIEMSEAEMAAAMMTGAV